MKAGLNLWDTATVYGMGESEKILGAFVAGVQRENVEISTKFTPQLAEVYENSVEKMALASIERMDCDYIDIYWIHNPMDVERWTTARRTALSSGHTWCWNRAHSLVNIIRRTRCLQRAIAVRSTIPYWKSSKPSRTR